MKPVNTLALATSAAGGAASAILGSIRFKTAAYVDGRFSKPFGVICPITWDLDQPLERFRHMSLFHLVTTGACRVETADGQFEECRAGDIMFMPFPSVHRIVAGEPEAFLRGENLGTPGPLPGATIITHGGGQEEIRLICGYIESLENLPAPLFRQLPRHFRYETGRDQLSADLVHIARRLAEDVFTHGRETAPAALNRIMETLFIRALDDLMNSGPALGALGAAMRDPLVARVLELIHTTAESDLSVAAIVDQLASSKSTASARFRKAAGVSIGKYIARLKLQKAAERLAATEQSICEVAASAGYGNEFAFSRAFRRVFGISPGRWRTANAATG